jgi:homoserine kinase
MNSSDFKMLARSLEDFVAEPVRSQWIPHYADVKSTALASGAFACNISGSGPSIFSFCDSPEKAQNVVRDIKKIYDKHQITNITYTGKIRKTGAEIVE